jgi:hypothetical protein
MKLGLLFLLQIAFSKLLGFLFLVCQIKMVKEKASLYLAFFKEKLSVHKDFHRYFAIGHHSFISRICDVVVESHVLFGKKLLGGKHAFS